MHLRLLQQAGRYCTGPMENPCPWTQQLGAGQGTPGSLVGQCTFVFRQLFWAPSEYKSRWNTWTTYIQLYLSVFCFQWLGSWIWSWLKSMLLCPLPILFCWKKGKKRSWRHQFIFSTNQNPADFPLIQFYCELKQPFCCKYFYSLCSSHPFHGGSPQKQKFVNLLLTSRRRIWGRWLVWGKDCQSLCPISSIAPGRR